MCALRLFIWAQFDAVMRLCYSPISLSEYMALRIISCLQSGCTGRAELMASANVYVCTTCWGRFPLSSVPISACLPGCPGYHGRERELEQLSEAVAAARMGEPRIVFVHGDPGIGKSALFRAFYHQLAAPQNDPDDYWPDMVTDLSSLGSPDQALLERRKKLLPPFLWLAGQGAFFG